MSDVVNDSARAICAFVLGVLLLFGSAFARAQTTEIPPELSTAPTYEMPAFEPRDGQFCTEPEGFEQVSENFDALLAHQNLFRTTYAELRLAYADVARLERWNDEYARHLAFTRTRFQTSVSVNMELRGSVFAAEAEVDRWRTRAKRRLFAAVGEGAAWLLVETFRFSFRH